MKAGRLEAFTDGVIAIIITIMVIELQVPDGATLAALAARGPTLAAYAVTFVNVGLFWNNHHHLLQATSRISGRVLWSNLFLLFWLSLVPFVVRWLDASHFAPLAVAAYGSVLGLSALGYQMTEQAIVACAPEGSRLVPALGRDLKGKASLLLYMVAVPCSFVERWLALALFLGVIAVWLVPDRRLERALG